MINDLLLAAWFGCVLGHVLIIVALMANEFLVPQTVILHRLVGMLGALELDVRRQVHILKLLEELLHYDGLALSVAEHALRIASFAEHCLVILGQLVLLLALHTYLVIALEQDG